MREDLQIGDGTIAYDPTKTGPLVVRALGSGDRFHGSRAARRRRIMDRPRAVSAPNGRPPGHDNLRGGFRVVAELIALTATPWALWHYSIPLAIAAVVVLIGLPAVFSTPGDRPGGDGPVDVSGFVTIGIVLLHLTAATVASWFIWPWWLATAVTALCIVVIGTEQTRWKALTTRLDKTHPESTA